ncbi:MAG: cobalamin-dependent protein [Candidatus Heimdallarchaeota archaeon]|nr:MAG: cobalamin-dependent protein [Candidatus Heimdallarchaeota archaeon]
MDIILINPPYNKELYKSKKSISVQPPVGLAYLASTLEKEGINVEILDANAEMLSIQDTADRAISSRARFVGITSVTTTIPLVYEISHKIKAESGITIVLGGPHVTFMAKRTLNECNAVDIIVRGEGEITLAEIIKHEDELSKVDGITFRDGKIIVENKERMPIQNIDEIPFPAYHLLPMELYQPGPFFNVGVSGRKFGRMIASRGCPNKCVFCSSSHFWGKFRMRSPDNIIEEIEHLIEIFGTKHIDFLDDTLTINKKRMERICDILIQKDIHIAWTCYSRVNTISDSLVRKMKRSGCFGISFGIESGNQRILDNINKNITIEQARKAMKIVKKHGIKVMCDFMIGLPGDDLNTVNQTIDFAVELSPDFAFFSITTPFPGTELYQKVLEKGLIESNYAWDAMNLHSSTIYRTEKLSTKELQELYSKAIKRFYYRPKFFAQALKRIIRNPKEIKGYASGGKHLLAG